MLGERLKECRRRKKLTQQDVSNRLGINHTTVSKWETNVYEPDAESLKRLAELFEVSLDYLLGSSYVQAIGRGTRLPADAIPVSNIIHVPVLGRIPAGEPIFAEENIIERVAMPNTGNYKEGDLFILEVKGDSMIGSRIYDGDRVLVRVQPEVESGEIAVVNVNGYDATLKRVKRTERGEIILYPDNPKYEPIFLNDMRARICGKVIQVMFDPNKKF